MFAGGHCHIASFLPTKCHEHNVTFLAANQAKDSTRHISEILFGKPHVKMSEATGKVICEYKQNSVFAVHWFWKANKHKSFLMWSKAYNNLVHGKVLAIQA